MGRRLRHELRRAPGLASLEDADLEVLFGFALMSSISALSDWTESLSSA